MNWQKFFHINVYDINNTLSTIESVPYEFVGINALKLRIVGLSPMLGAIL